MFSSAAFAEPPPDRDTYNGHGYIFYGAGFSETDYRGLNMIGGGGEALIYKGLGAGGELGYTYSHQRFEGGFGLASANASYHFVDRVEPRRFAPFLTGGYSALFRGAALSLFNYGAGAHYWFSDRAGVRLEVRNYQHHQFGQFQLAFRVGLSFR